MKEGKKCWQMRSLTGVIFTCVFLTACGGEVQENATETVKEAEGETTAATREFSIPKDFGHETAREAAFSQYYLSNTLLNTIGHLLV